MKSISATTLVTMLLVPAAATGNDMDACSATARRQFRACGHELRADYLTAVAGCINESRRSDREECLDEASTERGEATELCAGQRDARLEVCAAIGEARYDPDFSPGRFDRSFTNPTHPNRYFPLTIGNHWEYRSGGEHVTVDVLKRTKLIDGVRCIVVRDRVFDGGDLVEDTDDWFAQAKDGAVWYCGEEVKDYESFEGDRPGLPELVSIDGSFKAGRDGDKPGTIFLAHPVKGDVYREEFSLGSAEDVAEVLSTTYRYGTSRQLDRFVPRALADRLCAGDCVVTRNHTPLEPGVVERKYYAPGIGLFLETVPATGEIVRLTACNFDPRCASLPTR